MLRVVSPYMSKLIYHTLETSTTGEWDKTFASSCVLILKVLTHLPADLQVSSNFKLSDVLAVLFRKGALLPFLKEVMPVVWESIDVLFLLII